jgi:hypothetical protein
MMTTFAIQGRAGRKTEARELLDAIKISGMEKITTGEAKFVNKMEEQLEKYGCSISQLLWLREIKEKSK